MPADSILDDEIVGEPEVREWDDEVLEQLSRRYGTSREAVLRRLVTLRRATWDFYMHKRQEYLTAYEEQRKAEKRRKRESHGGPPPYRMAVRDRGRPYVRLVLDAYQREAITASSLSSSLGIKLRHLPALQRELRA